MPIIPDLYKLFQPIGNCFISFICFTVLRPENETIRSGDSVINLFLLDLLIRPMYNFTLNSFYFALKLTLPNRDSKFVSVAHKLFSAISFLDTLDQTSFMVRLYFIMMKTSLFVLRKFYPFVKPTNIV